MLIQALIALGVILGVLLIAAPADAQIQPAPRTCPATCDINAPQPARMNFPLGETCICKSADTTEVQVEINGGTPVRIPVAAGESLKMTVPPGCGVHTLRFSGCNAAGCSRWGAPLEGTFPVCNPPVVSEPGLTPAVP